MAFQSPLLKVIVFISVVDTIVYYWAQSITDGEGEGFWWMEDGFE